MTTFKSNVEGLKEAVFESGAVKHATQFTETLKEKAKYVQKKYNSDVAKMIKDVEHPLFKFLPKVITNPDGTTTQEQDGYLHVEKGL